jgi:putative membrane protein
LKKLSNLSGSEFDREFMRVMVDDHKKHVEEFRKQAKDARDPDVKLFASQTLPTLEAHLTQAQRLAPERSDTRGTSGTQAPPRPTDTGTTRPPGPDPLGRPNTGEPEPGRPSSPDPGNPR